MSDNLRPEDRLKTMRAVRGKRTSIERRLFSMLAGLGINGWKQNASDICGKPDVIFKEQKIAIFIDGCFWHGCPTCNRPLPQTNKDYWESKINRNKQRAKENNKLLYKDGWKVLRIWEHEIRTREDLETVRGKILILLREE
jgi:DNA mismatch endonuclease (patch repair protein)